MPAFIVRPRAEADVEAAFDWYEEQAEGLGHEFLRALDASYASIDALAPILPNRLSRGTSGLAPPVPLPGVLPGNTPRDRGPCLRPWETAPPPMEAQDLMPNKWLKHTAASGGGSLSIGR